MSITDRLFKEVLDLARTIDDDPAISVHVSYRERDEEADQGAADPYLAWIQGTGFKTTGATDEMALLELKAAITKSVDDIIASDQRKISAAEERIAALKKAIESKQTWRARVEDTKRKL